MSKGLRVYPLDPRLLSEEQIAVTFAMTSRRPEAFDEIAQIVTAEKAADFHERWVLNYGHASVAEHAIIHMAVENISRLACDTLEDNRLASYTEKSSRYQVIERGDYHLPPELAETPEHEPASAEPVEARRVYVETCDALFEAYHRLVEGLREYLRTVRPQRERERDGAYNLRLRREATDSARFLLPAATLTNAGVTINARSMEHAIRKLLSSDLAEERALGEALKSEGRSITPTLIKYADRNDYMVAAQDSMRQRVEPHVASTASLSAADHQEVRADLVHHDPDAEAKVAAALLYRYAHEPYADVWRRVQDMTPEERLEVLDQALGQLGAHDVPPRELETVDYTFDLLMDYGAYREYKRHRMQTYIPQPLTVEHGYVVPPLVREAGLESEFEGAMRCSAQGYHALAAYSPRIAEYLVTHAHRRRLLVKLNLRECYHLFKLRTQAQAHFSLVQVVADAMTKVRDSETGVHPGLFTHLRLRG